MITLLPEWSLNYKKFWEAISERNLLFIKFRYLAVLSLFTFLCFSYSIFGIKLLPIQKEVFLLSSFFLLFYNLTIHKFRSKIKPQSAGFNPLHLSVLQISVDLLLLTLLVYFTGGVESPFLPFFIFHMIIGSLILPNKVVYFFTTIVILTVTVITTFEFYGLIPHYCFYSLLNQEFYNQLPFVVITLTVFGITLLFSVFLANKIAHQLYVREGQLLQALDELKKSNDKKQKYIMGVMHEIKSPISASQSLVELMLNGFVGEISEGIKEKLFRVRIRNDEAIEMINDILRISSLHLLNEEELEEVNPLELLIEERKRFLESAEAKGISMQIMETKGKQQKVRCDKRVLKLAISNIFSNAVKYTQTGGKIIAEIIYQNDFVEIKICDNGKGIPDEEKEKVFVPFYRLKREKGKTEGVGFGLALVKEIVNQHNGEFLIISPSGLGDLRNPGTCFLIRLPYNLSLKKLNNNMKGE